MQRNQHLTARLLMYIIGLIVMAFGAALSCKANLGTSPISSVPWVLSMCTSKSVGEITIAMNLIFILLQPLLLRKIYWRQLLGQLATTLFFGTSIDISMFFLESFNPDALLIQWTACLLSIVLLALGVFMLVRAKIFMASGESLVNVLSFVSKKSFSLWKNAFDITLVIISISISLWNFGTLRGIGAGTVAAAILVGRIVHLFELKLHFFDRWKFTD